MSLVYYFSGTQCIWPLSDRWRKWNDNGNQSKQRLDSRDTML